MFHNYLLGLALEYRAVVPTLSANLVEYNIVVVIACHAPHVVVVAIAIIYESVTL